jgi:hypothetical protein
MLRDCQKNPAKIRFRAVLYGRHNRLPHAMHPVVTTSLLIHARERAELGLGRLARFDGGRINAGGFRYPMHE